MEDPTLRDTGFLAFQAREACCYPHTPEAREVFWSELYLPGVYTPRQDGSQILVLQFSHFCMRQLKIPMVWRRTLIAVIPTPEKPWGTLELSAYIPVVCRL